MENEHRKFYRQQGEIKSLKYRQEHFLLDYSTSLKLAHFDLARELLSEYLDEHFIENIYPKGIGSQIFDIIDTLSDKKRNKIQFPLLCSSTFDRLNSLSEKMDCSDIKLLRIICSGQSIKTLKFIGNQSDKSVDNRLNEIIGKIDEINLTKKISHPIDSARSSYAIGSTTADINEFERILISFYSHLLSSLRRKLSNSDPDALGVEAYALLRRAYANKGGIKAAKIEVTYGTKGGLRFIFDAMTEQLKYEEKEAYVNYVLKTTIDPLDWNAKVYLMKCLLEKLSNNLPEEITREPPERFVSNWEVIVRTYVRSIEQVKSMLNLY